MAATPSGGAVARQDLPRQPSRRVALALALLLAIGLALRIAILTSPLGELDGDEAVVGLMARHIAFLGERPVFFYNQHYLGSLEAFTVAPLFWLFNSSTFLLKLVPTLYSLGFLVLSAMLARRLFGDGPALITAAYLALPPAMWAVWSTKARGGYAEVLFLGEALLLVSLWVSDARRPAGTLLLWGMVAGLALWTHLLAVVYIAPCALYIIARRRHLLHWSDLALVVVGGTIGAMPMVVYNLSRGFPTIAALLLPADLPMDPGEQFFRFFRIGLPVLAGLAQPTTSPALFDHDWLKRPASKVVVEAVFLIGLAGILVIHWRSLARLFARVPRFGAGPALLLLLCMAVPPVISLTRFGFFVSEPRYAMPLYSAFPLVAYAIWRLPRRTWWLATGALLGFNMWSLLTSDVQLWRPEDSPNVTPAVRMELARYLESQDRHQVYADYWISYPLMFETRERVSTSVTFDGFNRYLPAADNVRQTLNPVWVIVPNSLEERQFDERLRLLGGSARVQEVAGLHVYLDVQPLEPMRPR